MYEVGQSVWIFDVNARGGEPTEGKVIKVGRKLVTVEHAWGVKQVFRIEDGRANDQYGHQWIRTTEQMAAEDRRKAVVNRLIAVGITLERRGRELPVEMLEAVADLVEAGRG